jgi:hypothetical protein
VNAPHVIAREYTGQFNLQRGWEGRSPACAALFAPSPLRDCGPNESVRPDDRDDQGYCAKRVQEDFNGFGHVQLKRAFLRNGYAVLNTRKGEADSKRKPRLGSGARLA